MLGEDQEKPEGGSGDEADESQDPDHGRSLSRVDAAGSGCLQDNCDDHPTQSTAHTGCQASAIQVASGSVRAKLPIRPLLVLAQLAEVLGHLLGVARRHRAGESAANLAALVLDLAAQQQLNLLEAG